MNGPVVESAHSCLDLLKVIWTSEAGDVRDTYAILLEISRTGGILHVDESIAAGSLITIHLDSERAVTAQVERYEQDEFGVYLYVQMTTPWFPLHYFPPYMLPDEDARSEAGNDVRSTPAAGERVNLTA